MSAFPELNHIGDLGEAARICTDDKLRPVLKSAADILRNALKTLCDDPSADHLAAVNGAWSHAARVYSAFRSPAPPAPLMPPVSGVELQRAA